MALKKLELLTLEMRTMKPTEASGVAKKVEEELHDVNLEDKIARPKRTRRKSRKSRTSKMNRENCEPAPLKETKVMVQNDAEQRTLNPAAEKKGKEKKTTTRRKSRRSKRTGLVAGSHEAGDQASQRDLGILMVLQNRGQNSQ